MSTSTEKKTKQRQKINLAELDKMRITDPLLDDVVTRVEGTEKQARVGLNLQSRIMSYFDAKVYRKVYTTELETFAVAVSGDNSVVLFINPVFADSLDDPVSAFEFALFHEATHVFMRDLATPNDLMTDDNYTIAVEICVNYFVLKRLSRKSLPTTTISNPVTGKTKTETVGIDPKKMYSDYSKQVSDPVSFETFVSTPLACYSELMRMPKPPSPKGKSVCVHMGASGVGDDDGSGDGLPQDAQTTSSIVKETLERIMQDALKGDSKAREELLDLAAATEGTSDKASKMWGALGIGALRGESVKTRKIEWWSRWLRRTIGTKTASGAKLIYPRKRAAILNALGYDSPMLHRGPEKTKRVVRAIDTSGSMSAEVLDRFFKVTGTTTGIEWIDISFDAVVMPYKAGERVYGGGGTSFKVVQDYVEGNLEVNGSKIEGRVDAVIVVTDGYAPEISPAAPNKWIWLVVENGSMWMEGTMSCHELDLPK